MEKSLVNKKEIFGKKARISYLEILILLVSSFAFCYMVSMADEGIKSETNRESVKLNENTKNNSGILKILIEELTKPMIARVSATSLNCCPLTKANDTCLDFESSSCSNSCSGACLPTQCKDSPDCKLGCCYGSNEGICSPNSPKASCTKGGGIWKSSADCNVNKVPECRPGCCVLGNNAEFVTQQRCLLLSQQRNLQVDFRAGITNEADCIALTFSQSRGACLLNDNSCKMLTNNGCRSLTGRNIVNALCTASALNSSCKPTNLTTCLEGKDEVYFQDSCGNAANIYDYSQRNNLSYWEKIVKKENSCGASSTNGNVNDKKCGNCLYLAGSKCNNYKDAKADKPEIGELVCADMSCKQAPSLVDAFGKVLARKDRKNGESWCIYDSQIGIDNSSAMSRDVVGSRHYRYSCADGKVSVEPCGDFRNEVCTEQSQFDVNGTNVLFSVASCRLNAWQSCIEANTQQTNKKDMKNGTCGTADCFVKKITIDSGFKFDVCTPINKEGFDTLGENAMKTAEQICKLATQTCTVIYKKKMLGGCECVQNCNCLEASKFTKQMNELCTSLGDCGGYVNINGEYTDSGYTVKKVGKLPQKFIDLYKTYTKPVAGQKVDALRSATVAGQFGFPAAGKKSSDGKSSNAGMMLGLGAAGVGFAAMGVIIAAEAIGGTIAMSIGVFSPLAGFATGAIVGGIAVLVGNFIGSMVGGDNPIVSALVSTAVAAVIVWAAAEYLGLCSIPGACIVAIIIIIINLIMQLFGGGSCPPKKVTYTCLPWQPPSGGANCEKCNSGTDLKPCSKYKCQSLGAACELINEGSDKELCIAKQNDGKMPAISPWYEILSSNFSYTNVSSSGFSVRESSGKCIEAFTPIIFGINTNKPSQCKIDLAHKIKYDDMENYFGDSNLYIYNHSQGFSMPSVELIMQCAGNNSNITESDIQKQISNTKIYTRCQDVFGNMNNNEYIIDLCSRSGPDKTAPYIVKAVPVSNTNLAFNTTSKEIIIYTNEPATCKWSKQDKSYSAMEASFLKGDDCEASLIGWQHTVTLTNLSKGENNFYFRCKDQPWLGGTINESRRNENSQSYLYKIRVTETPLEITRIIPNGTVVFGTWPASIDLIVDTAGGAENGKSWCYYKYGDNWDLFYSDSVPWEDTTSSHVQQGINLPELGAWSLPIKCSDGANDAYSNANFNLEWDQTSPLITRIYNAGGSLYVFTAENSECAYSNSYPNCNFIFSNGSQMNGGFTQEHTASWDTSRTYYIKCRDVWGNEPDGCSIRVRAYNDALSSF